MKIFPQYKSANKLTLIAASIIGLAACGSDDGSDGTDGTDGVNGSPGLSYLNYLLANNGSENAGTVDTVNQSGAVSKSFSTGANEGIAIDPSGDLVQAADLTDNAIRTICRINQRVAGGEYSSQYDREITGTTTGLANPKGIALAEDAGYVFGANLNELNISVFGTAAAGDVAPVATTTLSVKPWDLTYDEAKDRLFIALTDGTIAVYDDYMANGFTASAADRTITPSNSEGTKISVNAHGIAYDRASDRLVVSDVGDAASATDGAIFVISSASTADGGTQVDRHIYGPESMLGNPVDIILSGTELRVAEKSNDAVLVYSNIFASGSGDIAPDFVSSTSKPESLAEIHTMATHPDVSDTTDVNTVRAVAGSSNSTNISRFTTNLSAVTATFTGVTTIESVTFDIEGDAYATYGDETDGGIAVLNRVSKYRDSGSLDTSRDRQITGAATLLVNPKGLDVDSHQGAIFVADIGTNAARTETGVLIYSTCAAGNAAPLMGLYPSGGATPWDVDYDAETDKAFLALTNGTIAVFDNVMKKLDQGVTTVMTEDRLITPANSGVPVAAPTNMHGIDYDPVTDSLIVSDVGSAAVADDGKIYVIAAASSASGQTDVQVNIAGAATELGNPVDIMYDGKNLYVAEKSNGKILRFDDILKSAGGDIAPDLSIDYSAAESVAILPQHLVR